jgi:hypothetical protein
MLHRQPELRGRGLKTRCEPALQKKNLDLGLGLFWCVLTSTFGERAFHLLFFFGVFLGCLAVW